MTSLARRPGWRRAAVRAALRTVLIACVLSLFLPAGTSRILPPAVERSDPSTPAASEAPPLQLGIALDVDAEGWWPPEWSGVWVAGGGTLSEIDTGQWWLPPDRGRAWTRPRPGSLVGRGNGRRVRINALVRSTRQQHGPAARLDIGFVDAVINASGTGSHASRMPRRWRICCTRIDLDTGAASLAGSGSARAASARDVRRVPRRGVAESHASGDRPGRPANGREGDAARGHGIDRVRWLPGMGGNGRGHGLHQCSRRDELRERTRAGSRLGGLGGGPTLGALGDGFDVAFDLSAGSGSTGDGDARRRRQRRDRGRPARPSVHHARDDLGLGRPRVDRIPRRWPRASGSIAGPGDAPCRAGVPVVSPRSGS